GYGRTRRNSTALQRSAKVGSRIALGAARGNGIPENERADAAYTISLIKSAANFNFAKNSQQFRGSDFSNRTIAKIREDILGNPLHHVPGVICCPDKNLVGVPFPCTASKEEAIAVKKFLRRIKGLNRTNGGIGKGHGGILLARDSYTPKTGGYLWRLLLSVGQSISPHPLPGKTFWTVPNQDGVKSGGEGGI
ncbi:hypothetical protein, partial [Desulfovibrio sp. ZJ200]|uniref:hypothetical protein n=1 Tax=Desulfovibrio sp. ZJ200 TaxID=2709792 RepID=UPI0013EC6EB4